MLTLSLAISKQSEKKWYLHNGNTQTQITQYLTQKQKTKKTANCARYVNYALQLSGFLQKTQSFYSNANGKLVIGTAGFDFMKQKGIKHITFSDGKTIKNASLKKGDIVLWKSHTNVFKGIVDGKYTWYDGGKKCTDKPGSEGVLILNIKELEKRDLLLIIKFLEF